jgi:hypothetical protein
MKIGDTAQFGFWVSDDMPAEDIHDYKQRAQDSLNASAAYQGVKLGKFHWRTLRPNEEDAGTPPEEVTGINVRMLVVEADVTAIIQAKQQNNFVSDLGFKDLQRLREITREQYAKANNVPKNYLQDSACDEVLNELGPDVLEMIIREAVDASKH